MYSSHRYSFFSHTATPWSRYYYYFYFTDGQNETHRYPAQDYPARKWQKLVSNTDSLSPEPILLFTTIYCISVVPQLYCHEIYTEARSPGGGHGSPLEYSCLENSMDRGAWWASVHGITKSWTWPKWFSTHTPCTKLKCQFLWHSCSEVVLKWALEFALSDGT